MKYFSQCTTLQEVKDTYRKLAFANHPDYGGDVAIMQEINKEYAYVTAFLLSGSGMSEEKREREMKFSEEYRDVIQQIIHLPGITIEVVGLWIWVTGDTQPVKDQLKAAGLFWAPKKRAWYYRAEEFKVLRGGRKSLDEIRHRYGSEIIRTEEKERVTQH